VGRSLVQNGADFGPPGLPLVLDDMTLDVVPDLEPPLRLSLLLLFMGQAHIRYTCDVVRSFLLL